jgi:hypothetical protein
MKKMIIIALAIFYILIANLNGQSKSDNNSMLNKVWLLKKRESYSPWNLKIVPVIIDFTNNDSTVILRGYGKSSEREYLYTVENNILIIDEKRRFQINSISKNFLELIIGGDSYEYFELNGKDEKSTLKKIKQILSVKNKWNLDGQILEFSSEATNLVEEETYKVMEYVNGQKYFGTYFLDYYKGNIFMILIIDGKPNEIIYKVFNYSTTSIEVGEIDLKANRIKMILLKN